MPRIDVYLENLDRYQAKTMILACDATIRLETDGQTKHLRKTCDNDEIQILLHEIMDRPTRKQLLVDGEVRCAYRDGPCGPVSLWVQRRQDGGLRCEISRAPGTRETDPEAL